MANSGIRGKAAGLVIAVFLLGIALGALGMYYWGGQVLASHGHHFDQAKLLEDMTREVGLTADQKKQLEVVIEDTRGKFQAIHDQTQSQYDQVRQQARDRIRTFLTPEQRPKFEDFVHRLDEDRKKRERERQRR
jgi:Spy/CpxP family protein refolding chaperone